MSGSGSESGSSGGFGGSGFETAKTGSSRFTTIILLSCIANWFL